MKIKVCTGKACKERFSEYILTRLKSDLKFYDLNNIIIEESPCMGNCKKGPNISIDNKVENYINPAKASQMMMDRKNGKKPKKKKVKKENTDNN